MATTEDVVYIKQLILKEDIKWGTSTTTQVRSGILVTGHEVNTSFIPVLLSGHGEFTDMSLSVLLDMLITATGISPVSPQA